MERKIKERIIHQASEEVKRAIVSEIESGNNTITGASLEYQVSKSAIRSWLWDYGNYRSKTTIVEIVMKDEKETIKQLKIALAEAHLANRMYESLIKHADIEYKTDLKKNYGEAALKLAEQSLASKPCADSLEKPEMPSIKEIVQKK
jgi:transposase-like protein